MDDDLLARDLDEYMADDGLTDEPGPVPVPVDETEAAGLMRTLRWIEREDARIKGLAKAQADKAKAWADDRTSGLGKRREFVTRALEGWMRAHQFTTRTFPAGTARLRPGQFRLEVTDDAAFVAWATKEGRVDLLRPAPAKDAIKRLGKEAGTRDWPDATEVAHVVVEADTGEVIPHVVLVKARDKRFSVTPNP